MTSAPYASVVLPTFDRHTTLGYALGSVQAQTEAALEILVVLDGATEECHDVARRASRDDDRIEVLDLPKDAGRGEENVDLAVSSASGERIYYIDDDDVWLPHHVECLGERLDDADIVDSRTCSVDRRGGLHLGPTRGASPRVRELLAHEQIKMVYDCHVAHRRDAYGRFARWSSNGPYGDAVWGFLGAFAGHPKCRWVSHDSVSALSVHGAARHDLSADARAEELGRWYARRDDLDADLERAPSYFHLFRLLTVDSPSEGTLERYLARRGGFSDAATGRLEQAIFGVRSGDPPAAPLGAELAIALCEPVESVYEFVNIGFAWVDAYGQEAGEAILRDVAATEGPNACGRLAAYSVAVSKRDVAAALGLAREALEMGPERAGSLARWCAHLEEQG